MPLLTHVVIGEWSKVVRPCENRLAGLNARRSRVAGRVGQPELRHDFFQAITMMLVGRVKQRPAVMRYSPRILRNRAGSVCKAELPSTIAFSSRTPPGKPRQH